MNDHEPATCFIDFEIADDAALGRLRAVIDEFRCQKKAQAEPDEHHWVRFFEPSDRAAFWSPDGQEMEQWNAYWFSTPLPARHSPDMPAPAWDFGSMIETILGGEYEIGTVRLLNDTMARLEFEPQAYPYGGTEALRALVRCFGHHIEGFDDGTGFVKGDWVSPPWTPGMKLAEAVNAVPSAAPARRSFWRRLLGG